MKKLIQHIIPQDILKRIVDLTIKSYECYQQETLKRLVADVNEKLDLLLRSEYEKRLSLLKEEFQLRTKEINEYAKWKEFDRESLSEKFEAYILFGLQISISEKTSTLPLPQKEKFVRVEFLIKPTPRMLEMATYRDNKTGKEKSYAELARSVRNKLPDTLPKDFTIYTVSSSKDIDTDSIMLYNDTRKDTNLIIPEGPYIELSIGKFTKSVAYRHALLAFIERLKDEVHKLEPLAKNEKKKREKIVKQKNQRKSEKRALHWKKQKDVDDPKFNLLKEALEKAGYIKKINGNTFKSAFRVTIETPAEIDWIGKNAMTNMLYFLYLIWDKKNAKPEKQKFTVIPNCFILKGNSIEDNQLTSLRVRFNQVKKYAEGKEPITQEWMKTMMEKMQGIIEEVS